MNLKINERLKQLRTSNNKTQKEIADFLGIHSVSVQRFEYGDRRPSIEKLVLLADFFNVSVDYLLGRTDNPEINK